MLYVHYISINPGKRARSPGSPPCWVWQGAAMLSGTQKGSCPGEGAGCSGAPAGGIWKLSHAGGVTVDCQWQGVFQKGSPHLAISTRCRLGLALQSSVTLGKSLSLCFPLNMKCIEGLCHKYTKIPVNTSFFFSFFLNLFFLFYNRFFSIEYFFKMPVALREIHWDSFSQIPIKVPLPQEDSRHLETLSSGEGAGSSCLELRIYSQF